MKKKAPNSCATCRHSVDWINGLYRCGSALSKRYKQVISQHEGCGQHQQMSTLDKAERVYAMSSDREDAA